LLVGLIKSLVMDSFIIMENAIINFTNYMIAFLIFVFLLNLNFRLNYNSK